MCRSLFTLRTDPVLWIQATVQGVNTGFVMICFMVAETPDCGTSSGPVSAKNHRGRRVEVRFRTGSVRGGGATSSGNRLRHNTGLQQRQR